MIGFILVIAAVVIGVAVVRWFLNVVRSGDAPARPAATRQRVRLARDGFWVEAPDADDGDLLRYRILADGTWRPGRAALTGSGREHFIYTGVTPADVMVLGIVAAGRRDDDTPPPSDPPPDRGRDAVFFPPAY